MVVNVFLLESVSEVPSEKRGAESAGATSPSKRVFTKESIGKSFLSHGRAS